MQGNPAPGIRLPAPRLFDACQADGCTARLRSHNRTGFCRAHQAITSRTPARFCALEGCDNKLRSTNKSGFCAKHPEHTPNVIKRNEGRRTQTREGRKTRPMCPAEGCTNRLRSDNKSGRCGAHTYAPLPVERQHCSIEGCGKRLDPRNTIGRCTEHRAKHWVAAICARDGCEKKINAKNLTGYCGDHTNGYRRDYMLKWKYGISSADHDALLAEQNGLCFLCHKPPKPDGVRAASRLHVDHDHETGQVRRLLCLSCNHGLGSFFDDPDLLRAAADYVESFRALSAA